MDAELAEKLNRRIRRIESIDSSSSSSSSHVDELDFSSTINFKSKHFNRRFSSSNAQNLRNIFEQFDIDGCEKIDLHRLKFLMEKLGLAQTHVRLKDLIRRFANDRDGLISFRDFLSIFRQATSDEAQLDEQSSLIFQFYAMLLEIDVAKEGVRAAKHFFEAKISAVKDHDEFQRNIRQEKEEQRRIDEAKVRRKIAFQHRRALFETA